MYSRGLKWLIAGGFCFPSFVGSRGSNTKQTTLRYSFYFPFRLGHHQ